MEEQNKIDEGISILAQTASSNTKSRNLLDSLLGYSSLLSGEDSKSLRNRMLSVLEKNQVVPKYENLYSEILSIPKLSEDIVFFNTFNVEKEFPLAVEKILKHYYPGSKARFYKNTIVLKMDSYFFKRIFNLIDFIETNENWKYFLNETNIPFMKSYFSIINLIDNLKSKAEQFENNVLSATDIFIKKNAAGLHSLVIPTMSGMPNDFLKVKKAYNIIANIITASYEMNMVAEMYPVVSTSISKKIDTVQKEFNAKKQDSINNLLKDLKSRIVPFDILELKKTKMDKNIAKGIKELGIEKLLIPYSNKFPLVKDYSNSNLLLSVYRKDIPENERENDDYKLFPTSKTEVDIDNYSYCGIFKVTSFDADSPFSVEGKAPNIVDEKWPMNMDSIHFLNLLLFSEEYTSIHEDVQKTIALVEYVSNLTPLKENSTITLDEHKNLIIDYLNTLFSEKLEIFTSIEDFKLPQDDIFKNLQESFDAAKIAMSKLSNSESIQIITAEETSVAATPVSGVPSIKLSYDGSRNKLIITSGSGSSTTSIYEESLGESMDIELLQRTAKNKIIELYGQMAPSVMFPITFLGTEVVVSTVTFDS